MVVDTPALTLIPYVIFPILYLLLMAFLLGMWAGDQLIMKGIRRQAWGHIIWRDDKVIVQPIPPDLNRNKPWHSRIWQDPPSAPISQG